jgi:hypothetical protein
MRSDQWTYEPPIIAQLVSKSGNGWQTQKQGKSGRHSEKRYGDVGSCMSSGIACQAFSPGEARVSPRGPRQADRLFLWRRRAHLGKRHLDSLLTKQLHACSSIVPPIPVPPEQGS